MIDVGPPPQLYIPARPALVRAHQGELDSLARMERELGIKAMLPGMVPVVAGAVATNPTLTQKGYGRVYGGSNTANLALSYGNVVSGSAPEAGDLVVWLVMSRDSSGDPNVTLTGSGWAQAKNYDASTLASTILAKVVTSDDIDTPPTAVSGPTLGSIGFWVAYSVSGPISALTVPTLNNEFAGASGASSQSVNSTALDEPNVAISIAGGGGSDDTPSISVSGASADIAFSTANNVWGSALTETGFLVVKTIGGASLTFSSGDDGTANHLASGYVGVTFA